MNEFYEGVIQFYQCFIRKQFKNFDFKSQLLHILSFLDPVKSQGIKQCTFDQLGDILPITFDKAAVKIEHREFVVDSDIDCTEGNATKLWVDIFHMKSPMGAHKYKDLATVALKLLSIPTSNADRERVFRQPCTKNKNRLSVISVYRNIIFPNWVPFQQNQQVLRTDYIR